MVKPVLTVIDGLAPLDNPAAKARARMRKVTPATLVRCPRCDGNAMMQVRLGMLWKQGKPTGGTKQTICATCHAKGEYVPLGI